MLFKSWATSVFFAISSIVVAKSMLKTHFLGEIFNKITHRKTAKETVKLNEEVKKIYS